MLSIGIGELQKNTAIFANLTEVIEIVDKRRKRSLAMVYPVRKQSVVGRLSGKYRERVKESHLGFDEIKETAMMLAMKEKYGLSS